MYRSDFHGTSDPNAIARLEAAAFAHLTVFTSSDCHEVTGKGSLVSLASVGSCASRFGDLKMFASKCKCGQMETLHMMARHQRCHQTINQLQRELSEPMGCKRPLVTITGACVLSMPGSLAFLPSTVPHVSRFPSILSTSVRRVPVERVPVWCRQGRCFAHMSDGSGQGADRKKVVFLGTPDVAALSLELLLEASRRGIGGEFDVVRAVSNPPARTGRKKVLQPSPVQALAESAGVPVMTPAAARDDEFLAELESLEPDLCITAAYGQFLPQRFLDIPKLGTLNIHPSLLPRYRGASPVQRCLEAGEPETGVTVAFTVLKMDAGPVVRQKVR